MLHLAAISANKLIRVVFVLIMYVGNPQMRQLMHTPS